MKIHTISFNDSSGVTLELCLRIRSTHFAAHQQHLASLDEFLTVEILCLLDDGALFYELDWFGSL